MIKKTKKKPKKLKLKKPAPPPPMEPKQYLRALKKLGLTVAGKPTAEALGLSLRQCQRLAVGEQPVPRPVEILLKQYLKHGIEDAEA